MTAHRVLALLAAGVAAAAIAVQAAAAADGPHAVAPLVFVQTNEPSGNRIVVYNRAASGLLTPAGIGQVRVPVLNTRERVELETALNL